MHHVVGSIACQILTALRVKDEGGESDTAWRRRPPRSAVGKREREEVVGWEQACKLLPRVADMSFPVYILRQVPLERDINIAIAIFLVEVANQERADTAMLI